MERGRGGGERGKMRRTEGDGNGNVKRGEREKGKVEGARGNEGGEGRE